VIDLQFNAHTQANLLTIIQNCLSNADMKKGQAITDQLLAYCKLDTLAMVKIVDALLARIDHG